MALCHTVVPVVSQDGSVSYKGAYPDEIALVTAAHCFGYSLKSVGTNKYSLSIMGDKRVYRIIGINSFESERRRMSIVV
jgi:magnesium-transporting ATPase (P-type)